MEEHDYDCRWLKPYAQKFFSHERINKYLHRAGFKTKVTVDNIPLDVQALMSTNPSAPEMKLTFKNSRIDLRILVGNETQRHRRYHFEPGSEHPHSYYENRMPGNSRIITCSENEFDPAKALREHLGYFFNQPGVAFKTLIIDADLLGQDGDHKFPQGGTIYSKYVKQVFAELAEEFSQLKHGLHVESFFVKCPLIFDMKEMLTFLPFIKPGVLKVVGICGKKGMDNSNLFQVTRTEQWQCARMVILEDLPTVQPIDFYNAKSAIVSVPMLRMGPIRGLMTKYMESDTPASAVINCPRNHSTINFFNCLVKELMYNAKEYNTKDGMYILGTTHPEIRVIVEGVKFVDDMLQLSIRREAVPLEK